MENVEVYVTSSKKSGREPRRQNSNRQRRRQKTLYLGYVVSGDVYGIANTSKQIRGFIVGSKAFYRKNSGIVATLIDDQYCLWQSDKDGKYEKVLYDDLIKIGE